MDNSPFISYSFFCEPKKEIKSLEKEKKEEIKETIKVDIKGAIKNPGLYELEEGSRIEDAIKKAGGKLENTDTSLINLSKICTDEMVIILYTKEEIEKMREGNTSIRYMEKECICPKIENDACITKSETETNKPTKGGKVSLNESTIEELMTLPGIGKSKAEEILTHRKNNGPFKSIEEIKNVNGIGDKTFEKLKPYLTI